MSSRRLQRAVDNPTLELKIVSASDVSHMDATDTMDVYAVVSLIGDDTQKKQTAKTPIDYDGGSNPTWNHIVKFSVNERGAKEGLLMIKVKLFGYWLEDEDDLYMGEVNVSVQELLASNPLPPFANGRNVNKMKSLTYPIKVIGETKPHARLSLSYRFKPVPVNDLYPPPQPLDYSPLFGQPVYPNPNPAIPGQPVIHSPQLQTTGQTKLAIELVIKNAKDIRKVNILNQMDVYASVTIRVDKKTMKRSNTPIASSAYQNQSWNHAVKFSLDNERAQDGSLMLHVELISHRPILGDKQIGEVDVSIQDLLCFNPLTDGDCNDMMLVTRVVSGSYGKKGTLNFTYRFLREQITVPKSPPSTNPQVEPFIMYHPISHQDGPSNGVVPIYMPPYQSHESYQHYLPPEKLQPRPQPQLLHDMQSQIYHSHGHQHYSSPEPMSQQQPHVPPKQPTQSQAQMSKLKWQGGTVAAIGLRAAQAIGGSFISDMMISDEFNIYELDA